MPRAGSTPVIRTTYDTKNILRWQFICRSVFVTTSDFSKEARDYLNKVQHRIVLINGDRLARLMIQNEVGVRARKTYVLRSVDEDYFTES